MSLNISMIQEQPHQPRISVIGCGGAGCNALRNMIEADLKGVTFIAANTDVQALDVNPAEKKISLGAKITEGLGAGANPEVGAASAEESYEEISEAIRGSHMVFITAGMGGGTGTGAAPVVARAAKDQGILTVAVVTKPFGFEGSRRMRVAEAGIEELQQCVDTVIVIPNQNLFRIATERTSLQDAFKLADEVLYKGVRGVTDLMIVPGFINLDFNDIKTVMSEMGQALMGTGEAEGERRAIMAAEMAISSPLLDGISMAGARGVLINITGGDDMTLYEVDEAANRIREEVDPDANIIFGTATDPSLGEKIRVSVVATGLQSSTPARRGVTTHTQTSAVSAAAAAVKSPVAEKSVNTVEAALEATVEETKPAKNVKDFEQAAQKKEEQKSMFDDLDLDIPAFLRRQAN
ncbi:MAG: cell division protein FtsZ [Magnetococcales bacterium]|nr:cell division protein FtsZ [Magnetococcales bacterium]PPR17666.1 MAG: Cell division protein FtsZ [Pseudomonadota bacterium]